MKTWIGSGDTGALVDDAEAVVSAFDHGLTVGDGIFETMKVIDGRLFLWPWHAERLAVSAEIMRIPLPSIDVLTRIARTVADANRATEPMRLRLTVTAGLGPLGSDRLTVAPTLVCAQSPVPVRTGTASLHVVPWPRNERSVIAGVKSTSYAENVVALADARAHSADEALFLNTLGNVCEGTATNIFVVRSGDVITPPLSDGPLAGVTRRFVLTLGDDSLPVRESSISRRDLDSADEVFLSSSLQDIRAVGRIDGRDVPTGPVTAELARRFRERAAEPEHWS